MAVLPARPLARLVAAAAAVGGETGVFEPGEPFDVDVDELAGMTAAVTVRWLSRLEPPQSIQADALEHRAHRRGRQVQRGGNPGRGPTQLPQFLDRGLDRCVSPVGDRVRNRRTVLHRLAGVDPAQPAIARSLRTARRFRGLGDRPSMLTNTT